MVRADVCSAPNMEREMRRHGVPLYGLESKDYASEFDIFGFSLQYELNYTTVLNMLDLAGVPKFSRERTELTPLVIAGGPCVYNVEPVVDFFDIILVGEGGGSRRLWWSFTAKPKKRAGTRKHS